MAKLPVLSGKEVVKFLYKQGFAVIGQRGSHVKMKDSKGITAVVPMHRTLAPGTLLEILAEANVTRNDLMAYFVKKRR